jgi:hypothetical protein
VAVDRSKSGSASKSVIRPTWNMDVSISVPVLLRQAKVNDANFIAMSANTDQEVAWFDIAVNKMARMNIFQP